MSTRRWTYKWQYFHTMELYIGKKTDIVNNIGDFFTQYVERKNLDT